jgi:hypothetical protein
MILNRNFISIALAVLQFLDNQNQMSGIYSLIPG